MVIKLHIFIQYIFKDSSLTLCVFLETWPWMNEVMVWRRNTPHRLTCAVLMIQLGFVLLWLMRWNNFSWQTECWNRRSKGHLNTGGASVNCSRKTSEPCFVLSRNMWKVDSCCLRGGTLFASLGNVGGLPKIILAQ